MTQTIIPIVTVEECQQCGKTVLSSGMHTDEVCMDCASWEAYCDYMDDVNERKEWLNDNLMRYDFNGRTRDWYRVSI